MFNLRTRTLIKRELREKILSKTFILMTLLVPIFLFGILGFQTFLITYNGEDSANLLIISESADITQNIQKDFSAMPLFKTGKYKINFETESKTVLKTRIDSLKNNLLSGKLTGVIFVPISALKDKKIEYYSKNPGNNDLFQKIRSTINQALVDSYFYNKQLTKEDIEYARDIPAAEDIDLGRQNY